MPAVDRSSQGFEHTKPAGKGKTVLTSACLALIIWCLLISATGLPALLVQLDCTCRTKLGSILGHVHRPCANFSFKSDQNGTDQAVTLASVSSCFDKTYILSCHSSKRMFDGYDSYAVALSNYQRGSRL